MFDFAGSTIITDTDCYEWQGSKTHDGYGRIFAKGKTVLAHRLAYEQAKGPIPKGLLVCHTCDNPSCVNPEHLFMGTQQANMYDMMAKGRWAGKAYKYGRKKGAFTDQEVIAIRKRCAAGKESHQDIADDYGCHKITVAHIWQRITYKRVLGGPAFKSLCTKITRAQREEIVRRYRDGESSSRLALEFGVGKPLITHYHRKTDGYTSTKNQRHGVI